MKPKETYRWTIYFRDWGLEYIEATLPNIIERVAEVTSTNDTNVKFIFDEKHKRYIPLTDFEKMVEDHKKAVMWRYLFIFSEKSVAEVKTELG